MTDRDRLDELVDRWQALPEAGRDLGAAELCRGCPELAPALEREVALLRRFHRLAPPAAPAPDTASYADPGNPTPSHGAGRESAAPDPSDR